MKYLKKYKIPFSGLTTGKHNFEFEIENSFFDCFEQSLVKKGKLNALVELQKQENMLIVNFTIKGVITLTCDVCLQEFDSPLEIQERVLVKFVNESWDEDSEEIMVLSKNDYELDISTLLYEYINVSVPMYTRCSEQGVDLVCDPAMLEKLSEPTAEKDQEEEEKTDPRWAALKNIKNN